MVLRKSNAVDYILIAAVFAFALICVFPFYYILIVSVSNYAEIKGSILFFWPKGFNLTAYRGILGYRSFVNGFYVSVVRTALGTVAGVTLQAMLAYALSKRFLPGRRVLVLYCIFTFIFSGGMIPTYLVVKALGLVDTIWALVVPVLISTWNIIILISFFSSLPESIEDSAKIDGANDILIFIRIVVPLSLPAVATIGLFVAVGHWNALFDGIIYINRENLRPLQVVLMDMVANKGSMSLTILEDVQFPPYTMQCAVIFAATLPILVVYPFIQRYFVKGVMLGAIKG